MKLPRLPRFPTFGGAPTAIQIALLALTAPSSILLFHTADRLSAPLIESSAPALPMPAGIVLGVLAALCGAFAAHNAAIAHRCGSSLYRKWYR